MNRVVLTILVIFFAGCASDRRPVPPGEIPQLAPVTSSQEEYGHEVLSELTQQYPLSTDDKDINRVRNLVDRLAHAAQADKEPWHAYVLKGDDVVNAAATQGNHVFVWSGLLHAVQNDGELATVIAHEIGHLLANHPTLTPNEQATMAVPQVAGTVTRAVVSSTSSIGIVAQLADILVQELFTAALVNPESQRKELEADIIGMHLMAEAGFNPEEALHFWERIQNVPYFSSGSLSFLSSHPSSEVRLANIRENLPQAMSRYQGHAGGSLIGKGKAGPVSVTDINGERWVVEESSVSVHAEPLSDSPVVGHLARGDEVVVGGKNRRWLLLNAPLRGWIMGRYLSPRS